MIPFAAIGTLVVLGAVFGSFVCGWACPFGFLQDVIAWIPTRKFTLPAWMGCFRYVVLAVFVLAFRFCGARSIRCSSAAFAPRGHGSGRAEHGTAGHGGRADRLAHRREDDDPRPDLGRHALYLAAVVHAVLPVGGDLRAVQPLFAALPPLSAGSLQSSVTSAGACVLTVVGPSNVLTACAVSAAWSAPSVRP